MFQSTHPHGVRHDIGTKGVNTISFNPRTHTGCDLGQGVPEIVANVSIHAPTRGATTSVLPEQRGETVSIHAPTRGATRGGQANETYRHMFQSTHPHGVRPFVWIW